MSGSLYCCVEHDLHSPSPLSDAMVINKINKIRTYDFETTKILKLVSDRGYHCVLTSYKQFHMLALLPARFP